MRAALSSERGYAMLVALVLIALITIIGATSLSVAGVDQRVATHNRRHLMMLNTADAGTEHARYLLQSEDPVNEGWDTADTGNMFVAKADGETSFDGIVFPMSQGVYEVDAVFQKCAPPPPGYSVDTNKVSYRSDFWDMRSRATFDDATFTATNPTQSTVVLTLRKVVRGTCNFP